MSWQHNPSYNAPNAFPMTQSSYQPNPSSSQLYQHPPVKYMMPFPPEPTPGKIVKPMMPPPAHPPVHSSQTTTSPGYPATLPVQPQKAWLTPSEDWKPGDGMFDVNQLYCFTLPMTVASTPHNNSRDMSGMDLRDVRLVQVIHGDPRRGLALEHLSEVTASIAAAQPAYPGKGPCQFARTQHRRLQSAHQGS